MSKYKHVHNNQRVCQSVIHMDKLKGFIVEEVTVSRLQAHYDNDDFTIAEYVAYCLDRVRQLNPYLEAIIETNPDAIKIAQELDINRAAVKDRSSLYGIPVLVKDNTATADAMQTTAGSWALLGSKVPRDAFVVQKLRDAGAIILGHANMSEWASSRSKTYSTGYSPRGGQVRNPFDLRKTPFGSSSGSAVAVSANITSIALGTETDTSIIGPAGVNGVVGIKPTVGLTSRSGVIPISTNLDSVGSFGRTVADAVAGLTVIAGIDVQDKFTQVSERYQPDSYTDFISTREQLKGAYFGLPMKLCWDTCPPDCKAVASAVLDVMREAGANIVEVDLPSVEERIDPSGRWNWEHGAPDKSEWTVAKIDAYNDINAYLQQLCDSNMRSLEDIVQYNSDNNGSEGAVPGTVPAFPTGQDNLLEIVQAKGIRNVTYQAALDHIRRQTRQNGIDAALSWQDPTSNQVHHLDALLFCDRRGIGQQYAAQAGYPIICIPIGLDSCGMPVSLSFQQSAWKESELVKWASAVEDLLEVKNGRRATPKFKNLYAKNIPINGLS
ncbi:hypothetical protein LTS08_006875 [Lithohypha guttulata]|nr:hypothetical protein LTS08_006875 [Lithohypha guttulata]